MWITVVEQAVLLLALCWLLVLTLRWSKTSPRRGRLIAGLGFGLGAVVCMLDPLMVVPGVQLDARNAVLFVAALFGGPLPAVLATGVAAGFRLLLGGVGSMWGVLSMLLALGLGLVLRQALQWHWLALHRLRALVATLLLLVLVHASPLTVVLGLPPEQQGHALWLMGGLYLPVAVLLNLALIWILRDAVQRLREQQAFRQSESRLRAFTNTLPDLMFVVDTEGRYLEVMAVDSEQLMLPRNQLVGRRIDEVFEPEQAMLFMAFIRRAVVERRVQTMVYELSVQGRSRSFEARGQLLDEPHHGRQALVVLVRDITEHKSNAERLEQLEFYDHLTGLPNRTLLHERLRRVLQRGPGQCAALVMIDVDNFKNINELWGHKLGDALLCELAGRLSQVVGVGNTVARLGGDEFMLLLEQLPLEPAPALAKLEAMMGRLQRQLAQPFKHELAVITPGASMGVVMLGHPPVGMDELMQRAEIAMYQAKAEGKDKWRFFEPQMQAALSQRLTLEQEIIEGIQQRQFVVHFQPQLLHRQVVGAEALVRWQHPDRGLLAPAAFIAVAESCDLMNSIDQLVLAQSCRQLAQWAQDPRLAGVTVSVNVSARRLYQPDFVDEVLGLLQQTGANPALLKLELTESSLLDDMPSAIESMKILRQHGVRFAIDDFGTGYSSLLYLQRLPLDQLKIDQSFVRALPDDKNSLEIVRTIITLADSLGLDVIAEGVETEAQYHTLLNQGCHRFQGYYLGHPMPIAAFEHIARGKAELKFRPGTIRAADSSEA